MASYGEQDLSTVSALPILLAKRLYEMCSKQESEP